jgi:hypothetical protein
VFRTTDAGQTWVDFNGGALLNTYTVRALAFNSVDARLFAGAAHSTNPAGQGIFKYQFVPQSSGKWQDEIPASYALFQNYPNPFNPITRIAYGLPEQSQVTLRIYGVLGQEIKTMVDEDQGAGYHEVVWDGKNSDGAQVSSGVYFFKLDAIGTSGITFSSLKKLVFMK